MKEKCGFKAAPRSIVFVKDDMPKGGSPGRPNQTQVISTAIRYASWHVAALTRYILLADSLNPKSTRKFRHKILSNDPEIVQCIHRLDTVDKMNRAVVCSLMKRSKACSGYDIVCKTPHSKSTAGIQGKVTKLEC
jgi:hypothetical protein